MKKFIRLSAVFALFMSLLFSVVTTVDAKGSKKPLANLLMVPLDDRPANLYFPQQVGKTAGVNILTPPKDLIGFYDNPGQGQEISEWVLANAEQADGFVISSSMLAYGGLIASRTGVQTKEKALENIQVIKELKEKYPDKPIYVYDMIQRLAVTAISEDYAKYYSQIREWAILYDKVHNLGFEEDRPRLEELEAIIPDDVLEDYLNARNRNHEINKRLIDWVDKDYIDYLILAQDDAAPYGLHRSERERLLDKVETLQVDDRVSVFPGADEVDVVLVSRFVNAIFEESPKFYVEYGGVHGKDWIAPFEDTTFDKNVERHIVSAGAQITKKQSEADIHLMLNTPSKEDSDRGQDIANMVERIKNLVDSRKQVAIGDVLLVNRADENFVTQLANNVDLTMLLSYSGWNTAGNALGITVGHAAARDAFLKQTSGFGVPVYKETAEANYEFLLHRFALDQGYKNVVMPGANQLIADIGANQWNLGENYEAVNQFVKEKLISETEKWYEYFDGKQVYIGSRGNKDFYSTIKDLEKVHVELPWPRTFETELETELELD
ncbi:DUF4127 family protein [Radiobacillus kanasensis]|uniref:DUF4127 family protein n=1 Tax=Radiobacillus kanasensis TaxID=2844358 RepID=UPI001E4C8DE8|nr:DUF4127 family protein [Radiobacillus kanasensis]UFT98835.1 DUF4127 family protein [Radiobacillus kanasensis]